MTELEEMRLFIGVPSNRDWKQRFGTSFIDLCVHLVIGGVKGYKLTNFAYRVFGQNSCLPVGREKLMDEMLQGGYTHFLALDDDMAFPRDIVDQLAKHNLDVVATNARHKGLEIKGSLVGIDEKPLDSSGKNGLEEIILMGGAIFLARIDAFRHIPWPHYQVLGLPEIREYLGEDRYFSKLLTLNGVKLWCDHDASQHIIHIGDYDYGWPTAEEILYKKLDYAALYGAALAEVKAQNFQ